MNIRLTISNFFARAAMLLFATVISIGAWAQFENAITNIKPLYIYPHTTTFNIKVKLTDDGDDLVYGSDYIVSAITGEGGVSISDGGVITFESKSIGEHTLEITGEGYYSGASLTIPFKIACFRSDDGTTIATGTEGDPFVIKKSEDLDLLSKAVSSGNEFKENNNKHFKLGADITYTYNSETKHNYTPIGGFSNNVIREFLGNFDGDGHTIKGIRVSISGEKGFVGLFGRLGSGAVVKNLTLDDANITGPQKTGGIAGINKGGIIYNCHVTCNVTIHANDNEWNSWHGGIVGSNESDDGVYGKVSNCTSAAKLTVDFNTWNFYGGIAGQNMSRCTLDHNLVIDAVLPIPTTTDKKCGAITGSNDPGNDSGNTSGILNYNYYDGCTLGIVGIGDNSSDATNQAEPATILTDTKGLRLPTSLSGKVVYFRAFRYGEPSTIILPFVPNRTENVDKFYTFKGVEKDGNYYKAIMEESTSLNYNTPYIYKAVKPNNETENFRLYFDCYDLESSASDVQEAGSTKPAEDTHWTFKGSYSEILWEALPSGQKRNVYGFAGQAVSDTEDSSKSIKAGEFVRIGEYVRLRPQRCYMEYTPTSSTRAGSLTDEELPETIRVILVDDGGKTDIGSLSPKTGIITFDSDAWYSLDGKRFSTQPAQKGIYVNNGKKVVIK